MVLVAALLLLTLQPLPASSETSTFNESHTHTMRPGDTLGTASTYAMWGAVESALASGAAKLQSDDVVVWNQAGLKAFALAAVVVVDIAPVSCSNETCIGHASLYIDTAAAIKSLKAIASSEDSIALFTRALEEKSNNLKQADKFSELISKGRAARAASAEMQNYRNSYLEAVENAYSWHWYFRGTALLATGRDADALEAYQNFMRINQKFYRAYLSRGAIYSKMDRHKLALEDFDKAVSLSPENAKALNSRGVAYYNLGDHRHALLDFTRSIGHDPTLANTYNNRGNSYLDSGSTKDAIKDYNKAIELDPEYSEAYNSRGTAYNTLGNSKGAIADFTRSIEHDPNYPDAYNNRGVTLHREGSIKEAIIDYTAAIRLKATYAEAYSNRGVALQQQGKLNMAHKDYSNAIMYSDGYAGAYLNRAVLNKLLKNNNEACSDAADACRLGDCRALVSFKNGGMCKEGS